MDDKAKKEKIIKENKEEIANDSNLTEQTVKQESTFSTKRFLKGNPFKAAYSLISGSKAGKTYTLMTLTFAFIAILIFFAILPTVTSITQIAKKIEDYKVVKEKQDEKLSNLNNLKYTVENPISAGGANEYVDFFINKYFPDSLNEEVVYRDIISFSNKTSTQVEVLKFLGVQNTPGEPKSGKSKASSYQIIVKSITHDNIIKLIKSISSSSHLYTIERISIISPSQMNVQAQEASQFTATINFLAYNYV
ncbi:MAG: hypothetical protein WCJ19_00490 [bacterium]